jgi:hypothetical protein
VVASVAVTAVVASVVASVVVVVAAVVVASVAWLVSPEPVSVPLPELVEPALVEPALVEATLVAVAPLVSVADPSLESSPLHAALTVRINKAERGRVGEGIIIVCQGDQPRLRNTRRT